MHPHKVKEKPSRAEVQGQCSRCWQSVHHATIYSVADRSIGIRKRKAFKSKRSRVEVKLTALTGEDIA